MNLPIAFALFIACLCTGVITWLDENPLISQECYENCVRMVYIFEIVVFVVADIAMFA